MILKRISFFITALLCTHFSFAQIQKSWHWKDLQTDSVHGVSLQKGYAFLQQLKITPQPIITAIIDGGIDTSHPALATHLWNNSKEIAGNGIDDDHNGYIDDIHGWNFLGGKNGNNINKASDEKSRLFHQFKNYFNQIDTNHLNRQNEDLFNQWKQAANELQPNENEAANLQYVTVSKNVLKKVGNIIIKEMGDSNFNISRLIQYEPIGRIALEGKLTYLKTFNVLGLDSSMGHLEIINDLEEYIEGKEKSFNSIEKEPEDIRATIIGDQAENISDQFYGNHDITGPNARHGTHVAGLASNEHPLIKIMGVRAVPDGDEYDKDVALAILYAVNNGAKVVNMSFGKSYSPHHYWVDSALRYAALKDVLLVHSAGNEHYDLNTKIVYPSPYSVFYKDTASTMITIGASSDPIIKNSLLTDFSNIGDKVVDILSPGEKIYSTLPNNNYGYMNGTSMASPIVTHIASLIRAYFPNLNAKEVKSILMQSVWTSNDESTKLLLSPSSKTAGIVNAYNAFVLADEINKKKNKKRK